MNKQKRTYQQRIFFYFLALFTFFTIVILIFQFNREKRYKIAQLENTLGNITGIAQKYISRHHVFENGDFRMLDSLKTILPLENVRITVIDKNGQVRYDSFVADYGEMENHLARPEVEKARLFGKGSSIRYSSTTRQDFYYYVRFFNDYFIRTAVVYNVEIVHFLQAEKIFFFFLIFMFLVFGFLLFFVTRRLGDFITRLKDFAVRAGRDEKIESPVSFPDDELGVISQQIIQIYKKMKQAKDDLGNEKEKLFRHLQALNVGIAFFSAKKEKTLANSHFIQYINLISEKPTISAGDIFGIPEFSEISGFINNHLDDDFFPGQDGLPRHEITITRGDRFFQVQVIIFADKSFEILVTDISRPERRRRLKQQLTSNIAHELKTPLASIRGYLETILSNDVPPEKQNYFIRRAFAQSERLSDLINDVSLLNNIEDAGDLFGFNMLNIRRIIGDVIENLSSRLDPMNIRCEIGVDRSVELNGNDSLIFSVFQNLVENSIHYAGKNITIRINQYLEDEGNYYFSYSDNGPGIPEEHLPRIFERFYRVDKGRSRETGGTGLGLSIVKNAIQLHKGEISVRNRPEGGLKYLFSLAKR
ncbi:MAG: ATP-binding protein [Prolixibacteraceae bacterium]|nr:ATP-binding protein [Prolixibacteraceae bacterium]